MCQMIVWVVFSLVAKWDENCTTMPISSQQIRAGRGLLNMSQRELADKASISLNSLNNIERGIAHPKEETLLSIKSTLEENGVEFLEGHGVRMRGEQLGIEKIEGENLLERLYQEFLTTFSQGAGEILYVGIDNRRFEHMTSDRLEMYRQVETELIRRGVDERLLFLEGDTNFLSSRNVYRWVSKELFGEIPVIIYGNNIAIILWGPPQRMVIIRNAAISETFRRQFYAVWDTAKPVPEEIYQANRVGDV